MKFGKKITKDEERKIKKDMIKFYNEDSNYFNKIINRKKEVYRVFIPLLGLFKNKNIKILDVGCGTGNLLSLIHDQDYTNIEGIDACERFIKYAKKTNGTTFRRQDILNFNPRTKYDVIITTDFIEHTLYPEKILKKIFFLIKEKGFFILQGPNRLQILSYKANLAYKNLGRVSNKLISYYLIKNIKPFLIKPKLDSETYKIDDSDACYIINPFDILYFLNKHGLTLLYISTFYDPMRRYSGIKKKIILFLTKIPLLKYLGGSLFIVAFKKADFDKKEIKGLSLKVDEIIKIFY